MFLHERDAHTEVVALLEKYKETMPSCVIHCFTGNKEEAKKYLDMGCYIGLTGECCKAFYTALSWPKNAFYTFVGVTQIKSLFQ